MGKLKLKLLTPVKSLLDREAEHIALPTEEGILGIRPGHTPLVVGLKVGILEVFASDDQVRRYFISGGFAEVSNTHVTALVELAESSQDIDKDRALSAEKRAQDRLMVKTDRDLDIPRALASLARARARQRLASLDGQAGK